MALQGIRKERVMVYRPDTAIPALDKQTPKPCGIMRSAWLCTFPGSSSSKRTQWVPWPSSSLAPVLPALAKKLRKLLFLDPVERHFIIYRPLHRDIISGADIHRLQAVRITPRLATCKPHVSSIPLEVGSRHGVMQY